MGYKTGGSAVYQDSGWWLLTNAWGAKFLVDGVNYTMGTSYQDGNVTANTVFTWTFPEINPNDRSRILAYPDIGYGPAAKGDTVGYTPESHDFTSQVKNIISYTSTFDLAYGGNTGGYNVSYDLFFTSVPYGDKSTITNELMIWLHAGSVVPFGKLIGSYTDATFSGNIYYDAATHYIAAVSSTDLTSGTVDIASMVRSLQQYGLISGEEHIGGIFFGAEVIGGSGSLQMNDFSANLVTREADGTAELHALSGTGAVSSLVDAPTNPPAVIPVDRAPINLVLSKAIIDEKQTSGALLGTASATDPEGKVLKYALVDSANGTFTIDPSTGAITTTKTLLASDGINYSITARAYDPAGAYVDKAFTVSVRSTATGVNTAPTNLAVSNLSIAENSGAGFVVATASAVDAQGDALFYSLPVNAGGALKIDAKTGVITTVLSFDYEKMKSANFTLRVTDERGAYTEKAFTLAVTDMNEAPTKVTITSQAISDQSPVGTVLGKVSAIDPEGEQVTYSLVNDANGNVAVDPVTGVLSITKVADYSVRNGFLIMVRASDPEGNKYDKGTWIGITPNYAPRDVVLNAAALPFHGHAGDYAGTIRGVDPEGLAVTYTMVNDANGMFLVDPVTGVITTTEASDWNVKSGYNVTIRVSDPAGNKWDQGGWIPVTPPKLPTAVDDALSPMPEDGGTRMIAVADLLANDADGGTGSLTVTDVPYANGGVAVPSADGKSILFTPNPDYNGPANFTYKIDNGEATKLATVSFDVTPVNDAPTAVTLSASTVAENSAPGTVIGTLGAIDPDMGDTFTYSLVDNAGGRFAIDSAAGTLVVGSGAPIDYETARSHLVTVRVTDAAGAIFDQTLTIAVGDVNEAPTAVTQNFSSVAENSIAGTVVGKLGAVDPDADDTFTYTLLDNAGGRFAIDKTAGTLVVADGAPIDYETATSHQVTVRVADAAGAVFDQVLTIGVTDVVEMSRNGTAGADAITITTGESWTVNGLAGADTIITSGGGDIVDGGLGNDWISTGAGNDIILFGVAAGRDTIDGGSGYDVIQANADNAQLTWGSYSEIEAFSSGGFANVSVVGTSANELIDLSGYTIKGTILFDGGSGNDTIIGTSGDDLLAGGTGVDTLFGGKGNDVFLFGTSVGADVIDGGEGYDVIRAQQDEAQLYWGSFTGIEAISSGGFANVQILGSNSGDLIDLSTYNLIGISAINGQGGNDTIIGSSAADTIIGGNGNDVLSGGGGNDLFLIGTTAGFDVIDGGSGFDEVRASADGAVIGWGGFTSIELISSGGYTGVQIAGTSGADLMDLSGEQLSGITLITGGGGNDTIIGSAGADTVTGGEGADLLTGGAGADTFMFATARDSRADTGIDTITDFIDGFDKIDVSRIDANSLIAGDQAFTFLGTADFNGQRGALRYDVSSQPGFTHVLFDTNGDKIADFDLILTGTHTLTANDFLL